LFRKLHPSFAVPQGTHKKRTKLFWAAEQTQGIVSRHAGAITIITFDMNAMSSMIAHTPTKNKTKWAVVRHIGPSRCSKVLLKMGIARPIQTSRATIKRR
jgi:hypothetical protein